jgi:hypothetical protein
VAMFEISTRSGPLFTVSVDGHEVTVPAGASAAAAVLIAGSGATRVSLVDGSPRAPFCMMGVCFECLMDIDGEAEIQACMVAAREGMVIICRSIAEDVE